VLDRSPPRRSRAESAARASIAVAEAKVLTTEIRCRPAKSCSSWPAAAPALAEFNLDRHWRNARVHTLHDPVRWKYAVGAYRLNGTCRLAIPGFNDQTSGEQRSCLSPRRGHHQR
jgi:alkylation response protein AidB-like acyl-CoA dehydrogenase